MSGRILRAVCAGVVAVVLLVSVELQPVAQGHTPEEHVADVAAIKASLLAEGQDLAHACGAFKITSRFAWRHKDEGIGLIFSTGNGCTVNGVHYRADTVMYPGNPTGPTYDLLRLSESNNGDTSDPNAYNIPMFARVAVDQPGGNWRAPYDPGGPQPGPAPDPDPGPQPIPDDSQISKDLAQLRAEFLESNGRLTKASAEHEAALSAHAARLEALDRRLGELDVRLIGVEARPQFTYAEGKVLGFTVRLPLK